MLRNVWRRMVRREDIKVLMIGLDSAGRTTLLYRLALGSFETTIPTIGFNTERVLYNGRTIQFWEIGGGNRIRPLWRHYFDGTHVLAFTIDLTNGDYLHEAIAELTRVLQSPELRNASFLILLTKADCSNRAFTEEDVRSLIKGKGVSIDGDPRIKIQEISSADGEGIHEMLMWCIARAEASPATLPEPSLALAPPHPLALVLNELPLQPCMDFEAYFGQGDCCPSHTDILRVLFHVLLRVTQEQGSAGRVSEECLSTLAKKRPAHVTSAMFWIHTIRYHLARLFQEANDTESLHALAEGTAAERDELFESLLKSVPLLIWGELWKVHYSSDLFNSESARDTFVLPDLAPLPTLLIPTEVAQREEVIDSKELLFDSHFAQRFDAGTLQEFNTLSLVRIIYLRLQEMKITGEKRGSVVKRLMEKVQRLTMKLRASAQGAARESVMPYSETCIYFWVQLVNLAMTSLSDLSLPFDSFIALYPDLHPDRQPWKEYYTSEVFHAIASRREFVLPDLKPLPNVFPAATTTVGTEANTEPSHASLLKSSRVLAQQYDTILASFRLETLDELNHSAFLCILHAYLLPCVAEANTSECMDTMITQLEKFWTAKRAKSDNPLYQNPGLTYLSFWIQAMVSRLHASDYPTDVPNFFQSNCDLLWPQLIFRHYSEACCFSLEGRALMQLPDRMPLC